MRHARGAEKERRRGSTAGVEKKMGKREGTGVTVADLVHVLEKVE